MLNKAQALTFAQAIYEKAQEEIHVDDGLPFSASDLKIIKMALNKMGFGVERFIPAIPGTTNIRDESLPEHTMYRQGKFKKYFPYLVINDQGDEDRFVEKWLVQTFKRTVWFVNNPARVSKAEALQRLMRLIHTSTPFEQILLTDEGDILIEAQPDTWKADSHDYHVPRLNDASQINPDSVGVHKFCGGSVKRVGATADVDTLYCKKCGLRRKISKKVQTYGELRRQLDDIRTAIEEAAQIISAARRRSL